MTEYWDVIVVPIGGEWSSAPTKADVTYFSAEAGHFITVNDVDVYTTTENPHTVKRQQYPKGAFVIPGSSWPPDGVTGFHAQVNPHPHPHDEVLNFLPGEWMDMGFGGGVVYANPNEGVKPRAGGKPKHGKASHDASKHGHKK